MRTGPGSREATHEETSMTNTNPINDLMAIARELRAQADANILLNHSGTSDFRNVPRNEAVIEHGGRSFAVALSRLALDVEQDLSVYVCFIRALTGFGPVTADCDDICRAIYDVKWKEPAVMSMPGCRWFIRVRREPFEASVFSA